MLDKKPRHVLYIFGVKTSDNELLESVDEVLRDLASRARNFFAFFNGGSKLYANFYKRIDDVNPPSLDLSVRRVSARKEAGELSDVSYRKYYRAYLSLMAIALVAMVREVVRPLQRSPSVAGSGGVIVMAPTASAPNKGKNKRIVVPVTEELKLLKAQALKVLSYEALARRSWDGAVI